VTPWAIISPARLASSGLLRTQSDARLVDLVRAGNDRAFEAIVLRYHRPLLRRCRRLLPAGRAEDAVQQTLLRALEAIRADERELQLGAWLHRIAHNAAIDSLRRLDSHWEELDERLDGVEPTHVAVERRAHFRSVIAELDSLPERQRRALVLRELEGRSYDEIATALGVSGDGVRQLLNRARNAMRAAASALVPPALVGRVAGSQASVRIAELVDPPGTSALTAKATAAVAAGAVALLAVSGPGDRLTSPHAHATPQPPALERGAGAPEDPGRGAAARADLGESRSVSRDPSARQQSGRGAGRNAMVPGDSPAGGRLHTSVAPASRRQSGSIRTGGGRGETGSGDYDDIGPGAGDAPEDDAASAGDAPDDDETPGGDEGLDDGGRQVAATGAPDDDETPGGDDGLDDGGQQVAAAAADDEAAAADDDAPALAGLQVTASPESAYEDEDDADE
jgi:RNA polymerase sigma factor (sigma-70 family)